MVKGKNESKSGGFPAGLFEKTKPKPAFGRKSEILSSKSETKASYRA